MYPNGAVSRGVEAVSQETRIGWCWRTRNSIANGITDSSPATWCADSNPCQAWKEKLAFMAYAPRSACFSSSGVPATSPHRKRLLLGKNATLGRAPERTLAMRTRQALAARLDIHHSSGPAMLDPKNGSISNCRYSGILAPSRSTSIMTTMVATTRATLARRGSMVSVIQSEYYPIRQKDRKPV